VTRLLADHRAALGQPVALMTFSGRHVPDFFTVGQNVERVHLDAVKPARNLFRGFGTLREIVALRRALTHSAPDVVVSFIVRNNVVTILATRGLGVPVIISDRLDPRVHPLSLAWRMLRRLLYPLATHLVAQTETALAFHGDRVRRRGRVIPNPIPRPPSPGPSQERRRPGRRIVTMGRLHGQKGFDLLLQAFSEVSDRHPDWSLEIWGEGPERSALEALVIDLALAGSVQLPGLTKSPYDVLRAADLFVLSSRREGFPNALGEAMACGLPVISFDCPSGPREMIRDGIDGVLVPPGDPKELARAMDHLMSHPDDRARLASRAVEILDRFSVSRVMAIWDRLLMETVEDTPRASA
jgi:GalNAc-alpha-(1->4)-GalNAc-alpha-(1->3)-diNAcBac-PP-undecaprenol alpha-1,4-N-acetyl-D-galactosaminyltransferase